MKVAVSHRRTWEQDTRQTTGTK